MFYKKYNKYRFLFKKTLKLKENVQNKPLKKFLTLKKKKWKFFIKKLLKFNYKKKKFSNDLFFSPKHSYYRLFDNKKKFLLAKGVSLQKKYGYYLDIKKKFSLFYGLLSDSYIRSHVKAKKLKNLEKRLDVILYRCNFAISIKQARHFIKLKYVMVNGSIITSYSYIIKEGDLIKIVFKKTIFENLNVSNLWPIPIKYFIINYNTLEILISTNLINTNLSFLNSLWLSPNDLNNYYKC